MTAAMIRPRFVTSNDAVSAGIRAFEYGFWASHVEALMPDGTLLGAHYDGGVQARPHDYDRGQFVRQLTVDLPVDQATSDRFHAFLRSQVGKPYDLEAIAGLVAQREWRNPNAWFCSELIIAGLEHCGWLPRLATEISRITPRDALLIVSARVAITQEKAA
jgi:hypothetical protein